MLQGGDLDEVPGIVSRESGDLAGLRTSLSALAYLSRIGEKSSYLTWVAVLALGWQEPGFCRSS